MGNDIDMASVRSTRSVKKIEKPKPLKIVPSKQSSGDIPSQITVSSAEDILALLDAVSAAIHKKSLNDEIAYYTTALITKMKIFGQRLEENYKDQLDKAFGHFRNGSKDDNIDYNVRINLLHLIELRAMQWSLCASVNAYYLTKCCIPEVPENSDITPVTNNNNILGPGEIIKSSGKYSAPTKVPGKNYYKDEVVIRNADSGKVMGIRGRRVHMIEELSETVISFQRVSPGAKERNVQITGPEEEKIVLAKQLIEDTIKRNASPIRELEKNGSNSSINSSTSDDSAPTYQGKAPAQSKEDSYEYRHSVSFGDKFIILASNDHDFIKWGKLLLESNIKFLEIEGKIQTTMNQKLTEPPQNNNTTSASSNNTVQPPSKGTIETPPSHEDERINIEPKKEEPPVDNKKRLLRNTSVRLVQYTRDFLLDLSGCKAASRPPHDWDRIAAVYPGIVKQGTSIFDAVLYLKKWKEIESKNVQLIDASADIDSE